MEPMSEKVSDVATPTPPMKRDRQRLRRNHQVVGLLVFWFSINFLISLFFQISGPNHPSGLLVYGSLGIIASEIVVIAFLLTMLPIGIWLRLVLASILVGAGFAALMMGEVVFRSYDMKEFASLIPGLPIIILGFASPFAMAKYFLRWRLSLGWLKPPASSNLSVSGLMAATTLVAASVAILNFGSDDARNENLVAASVCMGLGLVLVPLSRLLLRSRRRAFWLILISSAVFIGALLVIQFISLFGGFPGFWQCAGIAFGIASFIFFYGAALIVLVNSGGKLILPRGQIEAATAESKR